MICKNGGGRLAERRWDRVSRTGSPAAAPESEACKTSAPVGGTVTRHGSRETVLYWSNSNFKPSFQNKFEKFTSRQRSLISTQTNQLAILYWIICGSVSVFSNLDLAGFRKRERCMRVISS